MTDFDRVEERRLATAAAAGDRAATEVLLGLLYEQVRAVCCRICANDADGEDATQNALISIVRALPRFDNRSSVRTWAYRVATNSALDELRRRARRPIPTADQLDWPAHDDTPSPDQRVVDRLGLNDALARLSPDFRAAVVLRDVVGMDYAEIADSLGLPIGTVRSRIARGRRHLAELLGGGNRSGTAIVGTDEP